jgi:hypothetical protein
MATVTTASMIHCPTCGHEQLEHTPLDSYLIRYTCSACGQELRPLPGDCCVFCSYGSTPCPSVQREREQRTAPIE